MNSRRIEIDEDWVIDMSARATLTTYINEIMLTNLVGRLAPEMQEDLIETLRLEMKAIKAPSGGSERDAVIASDIAVKLYEYADNLADLLRSRLLTTGAQ